jgi:hypothetical protein
MTNFNLEWFWNSHNDNHQIPILHKPIPMKHCHYNLILLYNFQWFIIIYVNIRFYFVIEHGYETIGGQGKIVN